MSPAASTATPAVPVIAVPDLPPGNQTSEFQITKYVAIVGGLLTLALTVCSQLQMFLPSGSKVAGYVTAAAAIITALLVVLKALGYTGGRSDQKVAAIEAQATVTAAQVQASASKNAGTAAAALE